jgi:plasmid stabilization system protein ParE
MDDAHSDIEDISRFIAQNSVSAAIRLTDRLYAAIDDLSLFPGRGRPAPDEKMAEMGFRMLGVNRYLVFYRIIGDTVYIYRIIHSARDYPALFGKYIGETDNNTTIGD